MNLLRNLLVIAVLGLLCAILVPIAWHIPGWLCGVDNLLAKAQTAVGSMTEAADTSNLASTEALNLIGSSTKLVDHATRSLHEMDSTVAAATETIQGINGDAADLRSAAVSSLGELDESTRELRRTLQAGGVALRDSQATLKATTEAVSGVNAVVRSPEVRATLANTQALTDNAAQTSADVRDYVHRATKPIGLLQRVGNKALQFGTKIVSYLLF